MLALPSPHNPGRGFTGALALLAAAAMTYAQAADTNQANFLPERVVSDNTVISQNDPPVEIKLPDSVKYVGSDRFLLTDPKLGDFDACELHVFIDSNDGQTVHKFYWIQFEAYLPGHPELHLTYDSPRHVTIGGLDFYVDTNVSAATNVPKPGSDGAHFYSLLASRGYRHEDHMSVRLVHLVDATKRKELMIIYAESLAPTGYTAAQLADGGTEHAKWAAIAGGLIRRAEQAIVIRPVQPNK